MRSGFFVLCLTLACACTALAQPVAPFVISHPTSVNAYPDELVTLSVMIGGDAPIDYQWRKDGADISGATNSSVWIIASLAAPIARYDVVAKNVAGSITSASALVYVSKRVQTITFAAPPTVVAAGTGVTLSATASSGLPVSFSIVSGPGALSGNVVTGLGGSIVVRANQAGNASFAAADAVDHTLTFVAGALSPFITTPPAATTATAGTSLSLRASAIGTPLPAYQWQKDGTAIPGATNSVLAFSNLNLADAARYTVTVSNIAGTASASAQLTVRDAPRFASGPGSQTVAAGTAVTLTVEVTGVPAPEFQWRRNGTAIPGATLAAYSLAAATSDFAGDYDVVVTNALGSATSNVATLTVITRDFTGAYFGRLPGTEGDAVLWVRANGTAAFFGHLVAQQAGLAGLALSVDLSGNVSGTVPLIAATSRDLTFRATIDEVAGKVTATLAELNLTFEGTRSVPRNPPPAAAGLYAAVLLGSGAARGYVVVAPDGHAMLLFASGTTIESAHGALGAEGRLAASTTTQATVDFGFTDGILRGTVRTPAGATGTVAGALDELTGPEHLVNLSVRGLTTNASPLITGFVIGGTAAKQVLIRAAGPAISRAPYNVANTLANPSIQLLRASTSIGQNNNWGTPAANGTAVTAATARAGAFPFPNGSVDAALVRTLQPGAYTVQVSGGAGVVLAEIYEVPAANEAPGSRRLINASTRGGVTPASPLIAGFVIGGSAPQRVLIRAAGPTLGGAPFNLQDVLANPQLTIYRGSTAVRNNDDWFRDSEAALIREATAKVRAFAFGNQSRDAALLAYLEPGAYTAVVTGPTNANAAQGTGLALVEIYEATP